MARPGSTRTQLLARLGRMGLHLALHAHVVDRSSSPSAAQIAVAAGLFTFALLGVSALVSFGVHNHVLHGELAAVGVLSVGISGVFGIAVAMIPHSYGSRVLGPFALGSVFCALFALFLFGPAGLIAAATIPLLSVFTNQQLGRGWSQLILWIGVLGATALTAASLRFIGAPAFVEPSSALHPIIAGFNLSALWLAAAAASLFRSVQPIPLPPPIAREIRTGSFTKSDLKQLSDPTTQSSQAQFEMQKLESLGVLAGGIAHDFNNLLMSILGNTSLARMEVGEENEAHAPLRDIEVAAKRARDLVGQLLAYAGKSTLAPVPLDLNLLVQEMGELLTTAIRKGVTIEYRLTPESCLIIAEPTQVRQVVMNLITNAADATHDRHGTILLQTEIRYVSKEELSTTLLASECEEGPYVLLQATDHGIGMDDRTLARIFDPFYTTKQTGRGLGLAAVVGIIRRYGGTMEVRSTLHKGTTFRIYLPFANLVDEDEDLPTDNTSTAAGWSSSAAGAILVVDDDPVVLKVTSRMVRRLKFEILEACDGAEALTIYRQHSSEITAVLLDMTMPGMTGLETMQAIRAEFPEARIILTSGYSESEIPLIDAGIFLQKPYSVKELTKALDLALA